MAEQRTPAPSGDAKHGPKIECRAWVRLPSNQRMMASTANTATTAWLGQVQDISRGGVAISLRRGFRQGTNLILDLATNAGELRSIPVQVVHAKEERRGRWLLGCAFTPPLSEQELQDLLSLSQTATEKFLRPAQARRAPQDQ